MKLNYNIKIMHVLDRAVAIVTPKSSEGDSEKGSDNSTESDSKGSTETEGKGKVRTFNLNPTAADMLQGVIDGLSEEEIVNRMTSMYEAPEDAMRKGVHAFIRQLVKAGIINA